MWRQRWWRRTYGTDQIEIAPQDPGGLPDHLGIGDLLEGYGLAGGLHKDVEALHLADVLAVGRHHRNHSLHHL